MAPNRASPHRAGIRGRLDWRAASEAIRDRLLPPDPGGLRLRAALRTTLTGLLAWALLDAVGGLVGSSTVEVIVAVAFGIYIAAFLHDATLAARAGTILWAVPVGAASMMAGTLLAPIQALAAAAMVGLVFLTVYANGFGPRLPALAQIALGGFTFALLSRPDRAAWPGWGTALAAAAVAGLLTHLVLLPDRPETVLRRLDRGLRAEIAAILARIDAALVAGGWAADERHRLLRQIRHLDAAAIAVETAGVAPASAVRLFDLEVVTERLARRALAQLPAQADERAAPHALIASVRARLDGGQPPVPPPPADTPLEITLANLADLLDLPAPVPAPVAAASPAAASAPVVHAAFPSPGLRHAVQAMIASAVAIGCGELVSPSRWYWAAMTAYVLFLGTRSRAESLAKGLQAVAGTLAGVVAGLLLASLFAGHFILSILGVFVAVFLGFQASSAAYGAMTFWLTVTLGLMYGLLGYVSDNLLVLRLEETAVGAVCGVATALLFLGASVSAVTRAAGREVLTALGRLVGASAATLAGGAADPELPALTLALDTRLTELRSAARTRLYGLAGVADLRLRRRIVTLSFCGQWARDLAVAARAAPAAPPPERAAILRQTGERIVAETGQLADLLDPRPDAAAASRIVLTPVGARPVVAGLFDEADHDPSTRHIRRLLQIDFAMERMLRESLPASARPG